MVLQAVFLKAVDPAVTTDPPVVLTSELFEVYADTDISECLEKIYQQILNYIDVYERNRSMWILNSLQSMDTAVCSLDPLRASAQHKLLTWIVSKRAVTNVKSPGFEGFKWAFLAGMHPTQSDSSRLSKYQQFEGLYDFSTVTYLVPLKDIERFCKVNDCYINVYGVTGTEVDGELGTVYPLKVTQNKPSARHVNLLLTEKDGTYHYSTIDNFSRLVRSQVTRHDTQHFFCYSCLHGFTREDLLTSHVQNFKVESAQCTEMPVNDTTLKFTRLHSQRMQTLNAYFNCNSKFMVQMSIRIHIPRKSRGIATLRYFKNTFHVASRSTLHPLILNTILKSLCTRAKMRQSNSLKRYRSKHLISTIITSRIQKQWYLLQLMRKSSSIKMNPVISVASRWE